MKERFEGEAGRQRLVEALVTQKLVGGNRQLATEMAEVVELVEVTKKTPIIEQGAEDTDIYLILSGSFSILVNGRLVAQRGPDDSVGEMAAVQLTQARSASVIADEKSVLAKLTQSQLEEFGNRYPEIYRCMARVLARRLEQRNRFVGTQREKITVFIISSVESLPVARAIQSNFEYDPFNIVIWTDGVFKVAHYTLESLEEQVDQSDFAIAIAHDDDTTKVRGKKWPSPRDNVIFELGFFMGRLGRHRAILMEPREEKVKLPSDLAGVITIPYKFTKGADAASSIAPACNKLRDHIERLGPNN